MKFNNLKEVTKYFAELNKGNYYLDYILEEGTASYEWYKAILEAVKKYKPKRVIDIGSNVNMFGYLFANEGIEYIGIDEDKTLKPIIADKISFIHNDYYNVRDQFKDDIIISCLCVGYLIPVEDVRGKVLFVNELEPDPSNKYNTKCIAKEIKLNK